MPRKSAREVAPQKVVDETSQVRGKAGVDGIIREEVFQDSRGKIVKYNLAFIHLGLCTVDKGRVLGYDNAHAFTSVIGWVECRRSISLAMRRL